MSSVNCAPPSGSQELLQQVARGVAAIPPPTPMEALETPGGGGSLADPATEAYQARQTEYDAAAHPCDSLENDGSGTSNMASNSMNPAGSTAMEDPANWASAMARIRKLWPGFSDELESCIWRIRTCVRTSGKYIGSQDVYYQLSDGTWLRSVAQLKKFLQQPTTTTVAAAPAAAAMAAPTAAAAAAPTAAAAAAPAAVYADTASLVMPSPRSAAFSAADDELPSNGLTPQAATPAPIATGAVLVTPDHVGATIVTVQQVVPSSAPATASPTAVLGSKNRKGGKLHAVTRDDPEQWQEMVSYICRGWPGVTVADLGLIEAGKCIIRQSGISEGRREWNYQLVGSDEWIRSVPKLRATICLGTTMGNAKAGDESTSLAAGAAPGHFAVVAATADDDVGPAGAPAGWASVQCHGLRGYVGELRWKVPARHEGPRAALMPLEDALYGQMQQHALTPAAEVEQRPRDAPTDTPALAAPHTQQPQQQAQDQLREMEQQREIEAAHAVGSEQQQPPPAAISAAAMVEAAPPAAQVSQTQVASANSAILERQARMPPSPAAATSANDGLLTDPQAPLALICSDAVGVDAAHAVCLTSRMQAAAAKVEAAVAGPSFLLGSADGNRLIQTHAMWQPQHQQQQELHGGQRQEQQSPDNAPTPTESDVHVLQSHNTSGDVLLQMLKQSLQPPRHQQQRAEDIQRPMPSFGVVPPSRPRTFEERQHLRQQGQQQQQPPQSMHKQQKVVIPRPSPQPQQDASQQARQPASYKERLQNNKQIEKRGIVGIISSNKQASGGARDSGQLRPKSKEAKNTQALDMYGARRSDKQDNNALRDLDNRRRLREETDLIKAVNGWRHGSRGSSKGGSRTTPSCKDKGTRMLSCNDRGKINSSSTDRKRSRPLSKDSSPNNHNSKSGCQTMLFDKDDMTAPRVAVVALSGVDAVGIGSPSNVHKKQRMMTDNKSSSAAIAGNDFAAPTVEQEIVYLRTEHQRLLSCEQSAKQHSKQLEQQVKALQQQVLQSEQQRQQQAQRLLEQQQQLQQQHNVNGVLMEHLGQLQHMQGLLALLAQPEIEQECPQGFALVRQ